MQLIYTIEAMQAISSSYPSDTAIGFVPTMGYLHAGHLSLVEQSNEQCDITVVSIFVNPTQFGAGEDLDSYPRDLERDIHLLEKAKVDYVFFPTDQQMYPDGYKSYIDVLEITSLYCGASRPGHFRGVATVVAKLVNIVKPDLMFMGEKDYQQIVVLETMLRELNFCTQIVRCPIIRESDGLAMSSRNKYLDPLQRQQALCLSKALIKTKELYGQGITDLETLKAHMQMIIDQSGGRTDYISFADAATLSPATAQTQNIRILIAVYIGKTRLIDNISLN
jgi:pantoate--beta-alanine ligase